MCNIKLIVGLANPGFKYTQTRHNVGSWYVNLLAQQQCKQLKKRDKFFGCIANVNLMGNNIHLLVPTTFMNLSGKAVLTVANFYHIEPHEILVAHDELDIPVGIAKIKFGGSNNGHNGLKDIQNKFGNNNQFYRLRIGISRPSDKNKILDFVLSEPSKIERALIHQVISESIQCTNILIQGGLKSTIQRLHQFKAL
ncbi:peptidyl-tRNA hydrolase [Serratia symbiotica str. 'Cinara cedri']|nr:peptidyl-tRNA hydrolase [Serratia symbiotica str. 'Cinara cedri']